MPKKRPLPKNVTEFLDRGQWRMRFRAKGKTTYYFKAKYGTEAFEKELAECRSGIVTTPNRTGSRIKPGTISALIAVYYSTADYLSLANSTKATYRGILRRFCDKYGHVLVRPITRQQVRRIIGLMKDRPTAANRLLERLKALMMIAVDEGWRSDDPTIGVKPFKIKSDGFHTWSEAEIEQYEQRHAIGTKARLAFALLLYLGQRRSDVVVMGKQHVTDGRISICQLKSKARLSVGIHPELALIIENTIRSETITGDMTFLVNEYGKAFSSAGFGNWFRKRCDEAELKHCSAHGLRISAARRLAEAGCSNQLIKSVTGHKTDKEVSRYTAAADQEAMADTAILSIGKPKREQKNGSL